MSVTMAVSFTPLAWFVLRRVPGHPLGYLMAASGLLATGATLAICWSAVPVIAWFSQWLWWPPVALIPLMLLVFPDGQLPSRRWRLLAGALLVLSLLVTASLATAALLAPETLLSDPGSPVPMIGRRLLRVALWAIGGVLLATVGVFLAVLLRWRRAATQERNQLVCLAPAAILLVAGVVMAVANVPGGWLPAVVALPIGMTLAILQFRLLDLDLYVHRGLVWLVLVGIAVSIYAVVVTALEGLMPANGSRTANLVAAAACAVALLPAERAAQRAVRRLVYGHRDDDYEVLMRVGRHLEAIRDPLEVLPRFVTTLVDTLKVPYAGVAVTVTDGDEPVVVDHGRRTGSDPIRYPMLAYGVEVGSLLVESRRPGTRFSAAETRLLQGLAGQAGLAAEASRSALELRRARERLVLAREEERRRIRRDLHDGVASSLVGAQMLVVAAQETLPVDGRAASLLETLSQDLAVCTDEVRSLIDGLRPAVLDAGLAPALDDLARRMSEVLPVVVSCSADLAELPAAVEVVAYRVVTEALSNVIKHAHATRATVELVRDQDELTVRISDDGAGPLAAGPTDVRGGVGLVSIRSRVDEVGGRFSVDTGAGGLCCQAVLPLDPGRLGA